VNVPAPGQGKSVRIRHPSRPCVTKSQNHLKEDSQEPFSKRRGVANSLERKKIPMAETLKIRKTVTWERKGTSRQTPEVPITSSLVKKQKGEFSEEIH